MSDDEYGLVTSEENNKTHVAIFTTSDGMVHVTYLGTFPTNSTQIGSSPPASLARIMLSEFVSKK